jgi:2-polyprenyl-3-methyl-5-hydroxy-6-metoxy-1,4-benzoquinol methylase
MRREDYLEQISCPVCGGNDHRKLFPIFHNNSNVLELLELKTVSEAVDIVACKICDHRYMTPVVKQEFMNRYYSILNSEFYHASNNEPFNYNFKEYNDYGEMIKGIKASGKILEIGCGNGFLLKMLEKLGYDCYGVEPSPMAYNHAKKKLGLNVENKFLTASSFYTQKFDVVILIDVVEHITGMQTFMKEVSSVMKEGGSIFIGTGNIDSLNAKIAGANWGYFLSWEHVSFFNKKSMQYLLQKNHFTNIKIEKTSLQHKPLQNLSEFIKNLFKKMANPLLKTKYYHGICYDHFIVTATYQKP